MVSFLDTGLLGVFSVIFTFLLVYSVIWGLLIWRKPFGDDNRGLYGIISLTVSFLLIISSTVRALIEFVVPWFLALGIFLFFIMFVMSVFTDKLDWKAISEDSTVYTVILILIFIILIAGLVHMFGQKTLEATTPGITPSPNYDTFTGHNNNNTFIGGDTRQNIPGSNPVIGGNVPVQNLAPGVATTTATRSYDTNLASTIFHPKVLGLILILLLSTLIIYFMSKPTTV